MLKIHMPRTFAPSRTAARQAVALAAAAFLLVAAAPGDPGSRSEHGRRVRAGQASPPASRVSSLEKDLEAPGLVDIQKLAPRIVVELKYSTPDNFLKQDVYGDLEKCYLIREVAAKLAEAEKVLEGCRPGWRIKVFDGARPRGIQRKMWEIVKGTSLQTFVANPESGSIHNFGAAVDVTIVDGAGAELDMGTPFDFFGDLAQPRFEKRFLEEGKLTAIEIANRELLRKVMTGAGFSGISVEWWHFDGFPVAEVRRRFKIIE